jgi:hypothetical protein
LNAVARDGVDAEEVIAAPVADDLTVGLEGDIDALPGRE